MLASFWQKNKEMIAFLSAMLAIISTGMGASWVIRSEISANRALIYQMQQDLDEFDRDRYTLPMAAEKALRTAILNPGMRVPDPRDPSSVFVVEGTKNESD